MKKIIFLILLCSTLTTAKAQQTKRLVFATSIGTGIAVNEPSSTPVTWQFTSYYAVSKRFYMGIGTGLSFYEKTLIPLFADVKFSLIKPSKFTPYLECGAGYSFAPGSSANGGFYLAPTVGIQYSIGQNKKLFFALGYELQKLERLKIQKQPLYTAEFAEKLNHSSISLKIGFIF